MVFFHGASFVDDVFVIRGFFFGGFVNKLTVFLFCFLVFGSFVPGFSFLRVCFFFAVFFALVWGGFLMSWLSWSAGDGGSPARPRPCHLANPKPSGELCEVSAVRNMRRDFRRIPSRAGSTRRRPIPVLFAAASEGGCLFFPFPLDVVWLCHLKPAIRAAFPTDLEDLVRQAARRRGDMDRKGPKPDQVSPEHESRPIRYDQVVSQFTRFGP